MFIKTSFVGTERTAANMLLTDVDDTCIDDIGMQATKLNEDDDPFQIVEQPSLQILLSNQPGGPSLYKRVPYNISG